MNEPTLLIVGATERRRRGRPPVRERRSSISTWVPVSLHDRAIQEASAREISISELVRDALVITLTKPKDTP